MAKEIVAYREGVRSWYITIDGKRHCSDFISVEDIRSWVGTMQAAGLYTGRDLLVPNEKTGRHQVIEPLYG